MLKILERPIMLWILLTAYLFSGCATNIPSSEIYPQVGFRILEKYTQDANFYTSENRPDGRPLFIRLWYPTRSSQPKMSYGQVIETLNLETENKNESASVRKKACFQKFNIVLRSFGVQDTANLDQRIEVFAEQSTRSIDKAEFPQKKFPLVIIGSGRPMYQLELSEQLAAQGFVVASIPRLGLEEGKSLPFDSLGVSSYVRDIDFLMRELKQFNFVDTERTALVTWSFEGLPALEYLSQNPGKIKALINLDAGTSYEYGVALFREINPSPNLDCPVLHFSGKESRYQKDFSLLRELGNQQPIYFESVSALEHRHFCSIASEMIPRYFQEKTSSEITDQVRQMQGQIIQFLQMTVGGEIIEGFKTMESEH